MPPLSEHQSTNTTKLLVLGDSGSGKSGALASLANAGYQLRIFDYDNGLDVLKSMIVHKDSPYKRESLRNVNFVTLTDKTKANTAGLLVPAAPTVWTRTVKMLEHWKITSKVPREGAPGEFDTIVTEDLGRVVDWGEKEILVIDSLSFLSKAAMNFCLSMNGKLGQRPSQPDWGAAQDKVEEILATLYDVNIRCNVILLAHIQWTGDEGMMKGYPSSLGKALFNKIPRYFNNVVQTRTVGKDERKLFTKSTQVELKSSNPLGVADSYPIASAYADFFRDVRTGI